MNEFASPMAGKHEFFSLLKTLRLSCNLTHAGIAKALGVTESLVSHWENGRCLPRKGNFNKILAAMKLGPDRREELTRAYRMAQAGPAIRKAFDKFAAAFNEAVAESSVNPEKGSLQQVKRAAWNKLVKRTQKFIQLYAGD